MAELTKYQQTGRVFSDVPQLDFANVRESFKRSQSLTSALDRISSFAFKGAAQETERVAERFAIDNPLTIDQVKEASKSGVTAEDLVAASGGGKVWQDTVRKMQGEQLRTQLEVVGKQALLDLQTQVDTNQITNMNDVRAKQEAIVNGLRKTLSFSPDSVVRFDTTMGSVTSALYKEAQDKLVKDYKINQQAQAKVNFDNSVRAFKSLFNHEDVQSPEMLREIEYALGEQVYRQSAEGGADFALKVRDEFFKEIEKAKTSSLVETALSPEFANDMTTAVTKIRSGDFGKFTQIYASLAEDEKKKLRQDVVSSWNDLYNSREADKKNVLLENQEANKQEIISMLRLPDNSKEKKKKAEGLFSKGAITIDLLKSITDPKDEGDGDIMAEAHADADISYGRVTSEGQLRKLYPSLNNKQVKRLLMGLTDKNVSNAKSAIRVAAGAAADLSVAIIDTSTATRVQTMTNMYMDNLREVDSNGKYVNTPEQALNKAIEGYPKTEKVTNARKKQTKSLERIRDNFPGFNPDSTDLDAYARKQKLNDVTKEKLRKALQDYNKAKQDTGLTSEAL